MSSEGMSCNCEVWGCTCEANWPPSSGRFCHLHGIPHPKGLLRMWQKFLLWRLLDHGGGRR